MRLVILMYCLLLSCFVVNCAPVGSTVAGTDSKCKYCCNLLHNMCYTACWVGMKVKVVFIEIAV